MGASAFRITSNLKLLETVRRFDDGVTVSDLRHILGKQLGTRLDIMAEKGLVKYKGKMINMHSAQMNKSSAYAITDKGLDMIQELKREFEDA